MENIKNLLLVLEKKYGDSIPLLQLLAHKYTVYGGVTELLDEGDNEDTNNNKKHLVTLSNNVQENKKFLNQLIDKTNKLIEDCHFDDENDVHAKVFAEYMKQLNKIPEKKFENGEKLADSLCKCIKKTILKLFHIDNYGKLISDYLKVSGFHLKFFDKEHRLSDDDLCQLDENLLQAYKEKTEDVEKNYQVIEMVQPIISMYYFDEDDKERAFCFIPGICRYFVKEVGR